MSNREILFKYWYSDGKSKFSQEFDLDQIANQDHWDVLCDSPLLRDYKIIDRRQYTGEDDQNGDKIFDGDRLLYIPENHEGSVSFRSGSFMTDCCGWGNEPLSNIETDEDCEIIGSVHTGVDDE